MLGRRSKTFGILILLVFMSLGLRQKHQPRLYPLPELPTFPKLPENFVPPTSEGVSLGRYLFYDPILSADSSISCGSCHQQKFAFSDGNNRFSRGINGQFTQRNALPLFNLAWYSSYFWDGKAKSLEEQVFHPVNAQNEMGLKWNRATERISRSAFYREKFYKVFGDHLIDSNRISNAIVQFEQTLLSYNSRYDKVLRGEAYFSEDEYKGFVLVNDQSMGDCLHCHITDAHALGTNAGFSNNGLDYADNIDEYKDSGKGGINGRAADYGSFKVPSFRNIALTAPYMHDGRFETLEEVLDFYSEGVQNGINTDVKMQFAHKGGVKLTAEEKRQIIAFLKTLTDSTFINEPEFANPFP